jgi:hypothetical protein
VLKIIPSTSSVGNGLTYLFRFIPSFSFASGVLNLANINLYSLLEGKIYILLIKILISFILTGYTIHPFDMINAGGDILYMGI